MLIGGHQFLCHGLCLGQTGFLGGHVDVVVDVAVAGGEMALCHTQEQTALVGGKFYHVDHNCNTPVLQKSGVIPVPGGKQTARRHVLSRCAPILFHVSIVKEKDAVHKIQNCRKWKANLRRFAKGRANKNRPERVRAVRMQLIEKNQVVVLVVEALLSFLETVSFQFREYSLYCRSGQ